MNFKRSTTSMAIALLALSLISMTSIQQDAFAAPLGMAITATADRNSNTINLTGTTISKMNDVTFRVTSPSGNNLVAISQVTPDSNGDFRTEFKIGPTWTENGFYTIKAMQQNSLYSLKVLVEVTNGMAKKTSVTESNLETGIYEAYTPNVAMDAGLELYAEAVLGSTTIEISGTTDRVSQDITLTVTAPNGNKVSVGQVSPMLNGEFTSTITTGGSLWKQDGFYTVTAKQFDDPKYTASAEVDIKDGVVVPEFGTIAAMILAVAVISIIAITAKSRLSIIPRY
ncbi:MAG: PEFG-CTERM sorting domain-containing protein [Nitrosopumilus sp.]|nr:PEFG-CTERM sorting domain-containing protein [Nitrosopumilus sp.]